MLLVKCQQSINLFFIRVFLLVSVILSSCKQAPKPVTEEEAYALLNELIIDDTLVMYEVYYTFSEFTLTDEMKKEFTTEEVVFMEKQIKASLPNRKVKPNKIAYFHQGYQAGDFAKLQYNADSGSVRHLSFPIISPDRKKLLIHIENDCNCFLGGSGSDNLYVKKNKRWVGVKSFNQWIS